LEGVAGVYFDDIFEHGGQHFVSECFSHLGMVSM
jgi:hypothetical protein